MLIYPELKLEPKPNKTKKLEVYVAKNFLDIFQHIRNIRRRSGGKIMVEYFSKYTMYCSSFPLGLIDSFLRTNECYLPYFFIHNKHTDSNDSDIPY